MFKIIAIESLVATASVNISEVAFSTAQNNGTKIVDFSLKCKMNAEISSLHWLTTTKLKYFEFNTLQKINCIFTMLKTQYWRFSINVDM